MLVVIEKEYFEAVRRSKTRKCCFRVGSSVLHTMKTTKTVAGQKSIEEICRQVVKRARIPTKPTLPFRLYSAH